MILSLKLTLMSTPFLIQCGVPKSICLDGEVKAGIADLNGKPDLILKAPLPPMQNVMPQSHMGTMTMIHQNDGQWHQTTVQSNVLSFGQRLFPRDVELLRNEGPLSQLLGGLGAFTLVRMDVNRDAQLVLNLPARLMA